jgi:uncharacterized protein (DUF849 family)
MLIIVILLVVILTRRDIGEMKTAEARGTLLREGAVPMISDEASDIPPAPGATPRALNMILPILTMVVLVPIFLIMTGEGDSWFARMQDGSGSSAILYSTSIAVALAIILYKAQGVLGVRESADTAIKGMGGMLPLAPDMASLSVGSNNFPTRVYENPPDLVDWLASEMLAYNVKPEIEAFDLSHMFQAASMVKDGRLKGPLHVQFVMGVKNAMPADRKVFEFYVETLKRLMPEATWTGAGIGRNQIELNRWSLELGGHCRTGLEDNVRLDKERLAPSNAALVQRVVDLCPQYGRHPASVAEARALLGLAA